MINEMSTSNNTFSNTTSITTTSTIINTTITTTNMTTNANSNNVARNLPARAARVPPATWNDQETRLLINQRKNRNTEFYQSSGVSRVAYWDSIARRVNRSAGAHFTGLQCRRKFDNLVSAYYVSNDIK
jgi:hypothetical protein